MAGPVPQPPNVGRAGGTRGTRQARVVARAVTVIPNRRRFPGQLPTEQLIWLRRRHPIFLFLPGWPVALSFIGLMLTHMYLGGIAGLAQFLQIIIALLVAALSVRWIIKDLSNWLFQYYILTDQRVIASHGYFRPAREEVVLKNVTQVMVDRKNPLMMVLGIGTVIVRPIGTPVVLADVARPRVVADSILAVQEKPPSRGGAAATPAKPRVHSQKIQATLDALAQPIPPPPPPPQTPAPFGGFLQRKVPIKFMEGESVAEVVYRHWFILFRRLLPAIALFIIGVAAAYSVERFGSPAQHSLVIWATLGGLVLGLGWGLLIYLNFADDIFVLTTHRVIDIDRFIFILTEYSNDAPYSRVQDIHVEMTFLGNILGYGTIVVETSGRKYPVKMTDVPHPLALMDRVFGYMNAAKEREGVAVINKQKKENYNWLANVLDELMVEAPDVRGLSLLDATARAHAAGLKLVVDSERPAHGFAPGQVLAQMPSPGTTELPDGELRVVLSGRPVPVTP